MLTNSGEEPIGFLLADVTRLMRGRFDRALEGARLGITPGEARTLVHVSRFAPLRQSVLASRMNIEPMTVVRYLDRLEERNLVHRAVDPADKRAKVVTLTREAKPLLREVVSLIQHAGEDAMLGLSAADVAALRSVLLTMRSNLTAVQERAG